MKSEEWIIIVAGVAIVGAVIMFGSASKKQQGQQPTSHPLVHPPTSAAPPPTHPLQQQVAYHPPSTSTSDSNCTCGPDNVITGLGCPHIGISCMVYQGMFNDLPAHIHTTCPKGTVPMEGGTCVKEWDSKAYPDAGTAI
jgi:hypothetical protein